MSSTFFKPTLQTKFNEQGNCLAAAISTLFDISIDEVPFFEEENWVLSLSRWASSKLGVFIVQVKLAEPSDHALFCGSLLITTIDSDNPKVDRHAVITKDGRIIFDPMVGAVNTPILSSMDPTFLVMSTTRTGAD